MNFVFLSLPQFFDCETNEDVYIFVFFMDRAVRISMVNDWEERIVVDPKVLGRETNNQRHSTFC